MIVHAGDDVPLKLPDGFIWLTLRQITRLMSQNNLINACSRSILSSLLFILHQRDVRSGSSGDTLTDTTPGNQTGELRNTLQWLDDRRAVNHILIRRIGLNELQEWRIDEKGFFSHLEKRFFRIVGMRVSSGAREVRNWCQPIIENPAPGIIGLLVRNGRSGIDVLMQAKAEVGNRHTVQLGPTVQFTQGNYEGSRKLKKPFLYDEFISPAPCCCKLVHESRQSEEGARFYRECHLHRILQLPDGAPLDLPDDYHWLPLEQVIFLIHLGEQVNSCARSILFCLMYRELP